MTAKEYLMQIHQIDLLIDQKQRELDDLKTRCTSIGSPDYTNDRVQTSLPADAQYTKDINKMIDLQQEIDQDIDKFVDYRHKIIGEIQGLDDDRYVDLLYKRYVEYKHFDQIAGEMNFAYQYVIELHGSALEAFERTYTNLYLYVL